MLNDIAALAISALLLLAYYAFLLQRMRLNPDFTIHTINQRVRTLWVVAAMKNSSKDIMAVQTLRNYVMAATFKASSAVLLIMGTLTLSGQADNMARAWHVLGIAGQGTEWWIAKILCLLATLIVAFFAFFAFSMTVRILNHVVFMVGLPLPDAVGALAPEKVAQRLNQAGKFYAIGMRAYFITVPLVFWLFGPMFLVAATLGLVIVLYFIDRSPENA